MQTTMVVNNDANFHAVIMWRFEKNDYTAQIASTGPDGLKQTGVRQPDLSAPDLVMPETDGPQFLLLSRGDPEEEGFPLIVLTAFPCRPYHDNISKLGTERLVVQPSSLVS